MLILTEFTEQRFAYAVSLVLRNYSGMVNITSDLAEFEKHEGPKIAYSTKISSTISIFPFEDIWQNKIIPLFVSIRKHQESLALFFNDANHFDIFAATFFMVTRYEEYLEVPRDLHERFESKNSITREIVGEPVVDQWRVEFEKEIVRHFPTVVFRSQQFTKELTVDVDSAFAYRHKGIYRTAGAMIKDIFSRKLSNLLKRTLVLTRLTHDPFETYRYIRSVAGDNHYKITWFFLLSDFSKEDINVPHTNRYFRRLIRSLASEDMAGIHPGYASNRDPDKLRTEIERLQKITGQNVIASRQHYLRMSFPATYKALVLENISHDYTMGYSDQVGFRAGTSLQFPWFDLSTNEITNLTIHPFVAMDSTLNKYLGLSPDEAIDMCQQLRRKVETTKGNYCLLWHNETVSETGIWRGWRRVFEKALADN